MNLTERFKYLFSKKISIFQEDIFWKGKRIIETEHFKNELYNNYGKTSCLFEDILANGKHVKESKVKTIATKPTLDGVWELVYAEYEDLIYLIHIKLRRK